MEEAQQNVLGTALEVCGLDPKTGYFRDGCCNTGPTDLGTHTVCAIITQDFLDFTRSRGNDLETPRPEFGFPGLKPGDQWCLCAMRWEEARVAGCAPNVRLKATNIKTLEYCDLDDLKAYDAERPVTARLN